MNNQNINSTEQNHYQEDEIDLKQLFRSLADRKWLIFGFTGFVTVLAIAYSLSIPPTYGSSISFLSPSKSSVIQINKTHLTSETSEIIYRRFLNNVLSGKSQRDVFIKNKYLDRLNVNNELIVGMDGYIGRFTNSIKVQPTIVSKKEGDIHYERPEVISMEGGNPEIISNFLNDLSISANKRTIDEFLAITKQKINIRLNEISMQRGLLLSSARRDRLSKIERIKIEDSQKINEINDQIQRLRIKSKNNRLDKILRIKNDNKLKIAKLNDQIKLLRIKAKQDRLNKIQLLTDAIIIADEVGIVDNNFKKINSDSASSITIEIDKGNQSFPKWYLYGRKALSKELDILKTRTNDDPYIAKLVGLQNKIKTIESDRDLINLHNRTNDDPYTPEIIDLQNTLISIKSNQTLQTLESRKDDSPFVAAINKLDIEVIKLKSFKLSSIGINAMQINQKAYPSKTPIKPKRKLIISVAFIAGFILSILLVFILNAFRPEKQAYRRHSANTCNSSFGKVTNTTFNSWRR